MKHCERFLDMSVGSRTGGLPEKLDQWERSVSTQMTTRGPSSENTRGRKFSHGGKQLWHTWDRPKEEILLSKRVSLALSTRAVERGVLTNGAEMGTDGDWERGRVWLKRLRTEERGITIYRRANSSSSELVYTGELIQGWDEDFAALWIVAMDEANLRDVPGRQAHEVVFILRRMVEQANEWRIPVLVMDCDVAAAFDHVSHHLIIDAMEALKVPLVLVAAWIREYRGSETCIKLDDILTPGVRRTRSVPQGDPCAATLFGASLDVPSREVGAARGWKRHGVTALR